MRAAPPVLLLPSSPLSPLARLSLTLARFFLLFSLFALLALGPAQAQVMPPPSYLLTVQAPTEPVQPGNLTLIAIRVQRDCPNAATLLDQEDVSLTLQGERRATVTGPGKVVFPQQVCAEQPRAEQQASYVVAVPEDVLADGDVLPDGNSTLLSFLATAQPSASGPLNSRGPEVAVPFTIAVVRPPAPATAETQPAEEAMPSPAFALVGLALLACAVVARRRR
jgi:MYXO-CTERM domain-containing protein